MDSSAGWFPTGGDDDRSMVVGDGLGGVSRKSAVPIGVHVVGGGRPGDLGGGVGGGLDPSRQTCRSATNRPGSLSLRS